MLRNVTRNLTNPHSGKQKVPVAMRPITSSTRLNIRLWSPSTAQWTLLRYLKDKRGDEHMAEKAKLGTVTRKFDVKVKVTIQQ